MHDVVGMAIALEHTNIHLSIALACPLLTYLMVDIAGASISYTSKRSITTKIA